MTELNAEQLGIMSKVRDRMKADFERRWTSEDAFARDSNGVFSDITRFICENIDQVVLKEFGDTYKTAAQVCAFSESLKLPIHKSMVTQEKGRTFHHSTLFIYLRNAVRGFESIDVDTQHYYAQLARLAWLDKILETGRIE